MLNGKRILIFGGGINQLTLVQAAKALGLEAIVADPNPEAPAKALADHFYCLAGPDYEGTKAAAIKHRVDGIATSQMENPMRLMARLAQELGLRFHSPATVERSLDKWLMKEAFLAHGVACAAGLRLGEGEPLDAAKLEALAFPLIVKPADATSSQGVFKADTLEEAERYLPISRQFSKTRQVILEEYIDGPEYSVESITYQGQTTVVQITDKFLTPLPLTVEMGHLQPAGLRPADRQAIVELTARAIAAIGIDDSASHAEVKLSSQGPKLIEIGARLGGDFISSYLVRESCGVDMDRAALQVALGQAPDLAPDREKHAYIKYLALPVGKTVREVQAWEGILAYPGVVFAHLNAPPGGLIPEITESKKRPGFVIVRGETRAEALALGGQYADWLASRVVFD